jgi:hypothetical protein
MIFFTTCDPLIPGCNAVFDREVEPNYSTRLVLEGPDHLQAHQFEDGEKSENYLCFSYLLRKEFMKGYAAHPCQDLH